MVGKYVRDAITTCLSIAVLVVTMSGCTRPAPVNEVERQRSVSDAQYRKDMEEMKKTMRGDVKIKLKKDGKGAYSWDISGKDPYEIIKTNTILSKKINGD